MILFFTSPTTGSGTGVSDRVLTVVLCCVAAVVAVLSLVLSGLVFQTLSHSWKVWRRKKRYACYSIDNVCWLLAIAGGGGGGGGRGGRGTGNAFFN